MTTLVLSQAKQLAERFGILDIEASELVNVLKQTAFKTKDTVSDAQLGALLIVAAQYNLNPFTRELFAYPDKNNGIVPVVSIDGWSRIINDNPQMDGIEFNYSENTSKHKQKTCYEWIECVIYRKDRSKPIVIRERFEEVVRDANFVTPWDSHPSRMHRHKSMIQCARIAFGFGGIFDQDEAERIVGGTVIDNETGEVTGKPDIKPQRKAAPKQENEDVKAEPKQAEAKKPEPQTDQAQDSQSPEPEQVQGDLMPKPGQLKWIEQKCASLGLDVADTLGAHGIESLEKMTLAEWETVKKDLMSL